MNRLISDRTLGVLIPFIILFALSLTLFSQVRFAADKYEHNLKTFAALDGGLDSYRQTLRKEWRPRLFTNWLASQFVSSVPHEAVEEGSEYWTVPFGSKTHYFSKEAYRVAVGRWVVFWFFLTGVLFIALRKERSILYLFGTYAAISMAYSPGVAFPEVIQIYPWDLSAVFFFALFVFLIERKCWRHLFWAIPLAVGFKETAILLCVAFLFQEAKSWKARAVSFSAAVLLCLLVKAGIGLLTNPEQFLFTMTHREQAGEPLRLGVNFFYILRYKWPATPMLVNAGTLLAFFLLPLITRTMWMLKTIALLFVAGILLFGLINEFRIFFEMIPFALYGLDIWFQGSCSRNS